MSTSVLCAVQPIFDAELIFIGQELLFRDDESGAAHILDADHATSRVLLNAFTGIQSEYSGTNCPTFVNVTRNLLLSGNLPGSIGGRVIYKYSAKSGLDTEVIEAFRELSEGGYSFALSDIEDWKNHLELLPFIDYAKFNTLELTPQQLQYNVDLLWSKEIKLIAEKIEDFPQFEACVKIGFDHYQGYFLTRPKTVKGKTLDAHTKVVLELIQELMDPETSPSRIELLLVQDVALTFKLLRILSSAAFAMPRKVESVKEAVVFLGLDHVRRWATLIALSTIEVKTPLLFPMQLVRARMCELLAEVNGFDKPKSYFMAGLFSMLDAMLEMDMAEVLKYIPLDDDIVAALLGHTGEIGSILMAVVQYEKADWGSLEEQKIADYAFHDTYLESLQWAKQMVGSINV